MKYRSFGIGVALLAVAALAYAAETFNLKRIPKVGQTYTYSLKMEFEMFGDRFEIRGEHVETVLELKENGQYVVEQDMVNGVTILEGTEVPMEDEPSIRVTMRTNGELAEIKPEYEESDVFAPSRLLADLGLILTKDSYKVGDKWSQEVPGDEEEEITASRLDVEVMGREKVLGIDSVRLKFTSTETEGSDPMTAEGSVWIDPKDGALVKLDMAASETLIRVLIERKV